MENQIVLLDTSILIDHYRKTDKTKSALFQLYKVYSEFSVSVITHYEIYVGAHADQIEIWDDIFKKFQVLPVDINVVRTATDLNKTLKKSSKLIDIADLLIAATALTHNYPLATLNKKHFNPIKDLELIEHWSCVSILTTQY